MSYGRATRIAGCFFLAMIMVSCQTFRGGHAPYQVSRAGYEQADASDTRLLVSLQDQQAWLLDGAGRAILRTEVSTGVPGYDTPVGDHKVLEKLEQKRSNKYGKYVNAKTGKVVVPKTWLHKGPAPEGTVYEGISMPYWMRLTWDGVGMHVGKFPYYTRCSFGCIRVYKHAQPLIYAKTRVGTPVKIVQESKKLEFRIRKKTRDSR